MNYCRVCGMELTKNADICNSCLEVEAEIEKYRTERSRKRSKSQLTNHQHKPKEKKYANGNIRKQ